MVSVLSNSTMLPMRKESREFRHARRLLHVMSDNHDRVFLFQLENQVFNFGGGDRIKSRSGLIHQQHFRFYRQSARNAKRCC